ncbi:hypothetical protein HQ35_09400 [Porphyromonas cangingivalis]|uniref:Uncharacterized protein n=1 Tax=Porphyromonas cangingivalis TaxID=36874 RepID=A0A0A2EIB1_PORCN|nr:tetratricopeptide repeat protein [Porphyromonas cangingivalis]KGN78596.1 hypothetical protein HQ35_09400 [Porphyromonas cangingivalis]
MKRLIIMALLLFVSGGSHVAFGQKEVRQYSRKGTKLYKKKEYSKAEIEYRKALEINPNDKVSNYNLANTLYSTKRGEEAMKLYASLMETQKNSPGEKADLAHNLGNVFMSDKKYEEAIQAYKESLRARPDDEETRYNLALAQKLLEQQKQQQQQQQKQDDKQQENQDQNKDQQNNEQQQDQQDKKEDKTQQQEDPSEEKMSKDNAQKILEAFLKDEKDTQKKVDKAKQLRSRSGKNKKQW